MNTANNVITLGNQTDFSGTTFTETTTVSGGTDTCYIDWWRQTPSTSNIQYWYSYPVPQKDEVNELKAWLDGFMKNRKMTEKNLQIIQEKLEEFIS